MAKDMSQRIVDAMKKPDFIRNIVIAAHIDHGKTTLSDNLLAGAGMISEELAGKQRFMDFHEDEQERGITIDAANVSMLHTVSDTEYLINLIDSPGHSDFGFEVTRAMRAVDGAVVVVCAVEGIMPQTEIVLRQCLKEQVKPILFINKVDRLIKELRLTPEMMQQRLVKSIEALNVLIEKIAPKQYKQKWKVNVADGSVCFGSAYANWAMSIPFMQKQKVSFKDIIEAYENEDDEKIKKLAKLAPLHKVLLDAVIKHLPAPNVAQPYRIGSIWKGEDTEPIAQDLKESRTTGIFSFVTTKIINDKHAGDVCTGRVFSGKVKKGQEVYINSTEKARIQQVFVSKGPQRILIEEAVAGNIVGLTGLRGIAAGATISGEPITPFEQMKHIFEPVVTVAVEPKKAADVPKLVDILKVIEREDPALKIHINEETGEFLIAGMGELHLEVVTNRIKTEKGFDINISQPIVVYRESVSKLSPEVEGKSPNKHNKFYLVVESLPEGFSAAYQDGKISEMRVKKKDRELFDALIEAGVPKDEAEKTKDIYKGNIFVDGTRGIIALNEVMELMLDSFEETMNAGPLAREPCIKVKVKLMDATLHEDSIHRGPNQVYPAMREGLREAIKQATPVIYEPIQILEIDSPQDMMGSVAGVLSNRRGQVLNMDHNEDTITITAKLPVGESFGFSGDLKSATGGKGSYFMKDQVFEPLPREKQDEIVTQIRTRKGLGENQ